MGHISRPPLEGAADGSSPPPTSELHLAEEPEDLGYSWAAWAWPAEVVPALEVPWSGLEATGLLPVVLGGMTMEMSLWLLVLSASCLQMHLALRFGG